jgi:hypothetical protein
VVALPKPTISQFAAVIVNALLKLPGPVVVRPVICNRLAGEPAGDVLKY